MFFGRHIFTILNFLFVSHETIFSKDKTMCKKLDGEVKDKKVSQNTQLSKISSTYLFHMKQMIMTNQGIILNFV